VAFSTIRGGISGFMSSPLDNGFMGASLAGLLFAAVVGHAAEPVSAGPLYERFSLTLGLGERTEALGPLWSDERLGTERTVSLAPLFARREAPEVEALSWDLFYPLMTYDRYGAEYRYQFLQWVSLSGGQSQAGIGARRTTLFPLYFQQRSPDPKQNYTALLPFYGRMQNHFFREEVRFVLFPAYLQTRKKDVVTDNYLAPFFHLRHGQGLEGWQFWPLAGHEHKSPTTRTNGFGEVEPVGGHDKRFVLWPFYFNNRLGLGTTNPLSQHVLFPLVSSQRSPARDSTTYLWPLGLTLTHDREKQYREVGLAAPLVVFARGEGKTANRVWPFFSEVHTAHLESDFYLWPLFKYNRAHIDPLDRERMRLLLFLYSDLSEKNTESGKALRRTDLWPLFTARRDLEGNERFQMLALLEPFLPNNPSIERSYSRVWSIWRSERSARTGAASQSLLWNLYRREITPQRTKWSVLFGLVQCQTGAAGGGFWLFHVPLKQPRPAAAAAPGEPRSAVAPAAGAPAPK
jgi:hypothetical protein